MVFFQTFKIIHIYQRYRQFFVIFARRKRKKSPTLFSIKAWETVFFMLQVCLGQNLTG